MPPREMGPILQGDDSFTTFVWRHARAFGLIKPLLDAVGHQSILPTEVPEWIRTDRTTEIQRLSTIVRNLQAASSNTRIIQDEADDEHARVVRRIHTENAAKAERVVRLQAMLNQVNDWGPPEELKELQDVMRHNLQHAIDAQRMEEEPRRPSPEEWIRNLIGAFQEQLDALRRVQEVEDVKFARLHAWYAALVSTMGPDPTIHVTVEEAPIVQTPPTPPPPSDPEPAELPTDLWARLLNEDDQRRR